MESKGCLCDPLRSRHESHGRHPYSKTWLAYTTSPEKNWQSSQFQPLNEALTVVAKQGPTSKSLRDDQWRLSWIFQSGMDRHLSVSLSEFHASVVMCVDHDRHVASLLNNFATCTERRSRPRGLRRTPCPPKFVLN